MRDMPARKHTTGRVAVSATILAILALLASSVALSPPAAHAQSAYPNITDNNAFLMAMGSGSRIELHAADAAKVSWTHLRQTANQGATVLRLADATGWEVGDQIAIASSSERPEHDEVRTITQVQDGGRTVLVDRGLDHGHYSGRRTYSNGLSGADARTWTLDQRAEVALLSRNVTIQGDANSEQDGFGGHTMTMAGAEHHISGVELYRMGQVNRNGRYPIHYHMLGDASGQYVTNSSSHRSYNKGATIHGTFNTLFQDNVLFDHQGHGLYLEDGAEHGHSILGNIAFGTHATDGSLLASEETQVSSFWLDNPANTFVGNVAAGSDKFGVWIKDLEAFHGPSANAFDFNTTPRSYDDLVFEDNVTHSSQEGLFFTGIGPDSGMMVLRDSTTYSIQRQGIWMSSRDGAVMDNMIFADYGLDGSQFSSGWAEGSAGGIIKDTLYVGNSDNPFETTNRAQGAIKVYRGAEVGIDHSHVVNDFRAVRNVSWFNDSETSWAHKLTTDNVGATYYHTNFPNFDLAVVNGVGPMLSSRLLDIDGSLTRQPGTWITPVLRGGNKFVAGFEATTADTPGPVDTWLSNARDGSVGSATFRLYPRGANISRIHLTRDDGMTYEIDSGTGLRVTGNDWRKSILTATRADRETAYLLQLQNPNSPFLSIELDGLLDGETIIYQVPNVARLRSLDTGNPVASNWNQFFASNESIVFHNNGSLFVRLVARVDPADEKYADTTASESPGGLFTAQAKVTARIEMDSSTANEYKTESLDNELIRRIETTDAPSRPNFSNPQPLADTPARERARIAPSTSNTTEITGSMARWSNRSTWSDLQVPGGNDHVVIKTGETVVLDADATVKGIIIDGGELLVEDSSDLQLVADWVLVINGGLFQVGTERVPHQNDFTLELTGDNPNLRINTQDLVAGRVADTSFLSNAPTPPAPATPTTPAPDAPARYDFDFGTASSPVRAGWTRVTSDTRSDVVSWSGGQLDARDRGASANEINRDFVFSNGARTLNLNIGDGVWRVAVNMGDASYAHSGMAVRAEGEVVASNIETAPGEFVYVGPRSEPGPQAFDVTVTDGQLNLEFSGGNPNWIVTRVSAQRIGDAPVPVPTATPLPTATPTPTPPPAPTSTPPTTPAERFDYDFGTPSSPVRAGWTRVTPDTRTGGVSWSGGRLDSRDRGGSANEINRDFVFSNEARTLNLDIGNGVWRVTVNMGDASYAHSSMAVRAEGELITSNVNTAAGEFAYVGPRPGPGPQAFNVTVTDGQLNVEFFGGNPNWTVTRLSARRIG